VKRVLTVGVSASRVVVYVLSDLAALMTLTVVVISVE
jgi:hypothetical protein